MPHEKDENEITATTPTTNSTVDLGPSTTDQGIPSCLINIEKGCTTETEDRDGHCSVKNSVKFSFTNKKLLMLNFICQNDLIEKHWSYIKICLQWLLLAIFLGYFTAVLVIPSRKEETDYWCDGDGFLLLNAIFFGSLLIYFKLIKPYCNQYIFTTINPLIKLLDKFNSNSKFKFAKYGTVICILFGFLLYDTADDHSRLVSAFGAVVFISLGALASRHPSKIKFEQIVWGVSLQFVFGLLILRWTFGKMMFECLGNKVSTFLSFTDVGTLFTFGDFLNSTNSYAFKILPVVLYFGMLISVLYHYGIIQWIIIKLGWILEVTMGTTPCESMATAANIFLGQSEAPLVIRPYVSKLTMSEIHTVMTGGFATVAGGVLAAYISFGIKASHLLSASIMSAPAALAMSKVLYPETEQSITKKENIKIEKEKDRNLLHSIMIDLKENMLLIAIITSVLIVFMSAAAFLNAFSDWFCQLLDADEGVCRIQNLLGYLLFPVAWLMGVPREDCYFVGYLLGTKIFVTEFLAYKELAEKFKQGLVSARAVVITTYALCGFSSVPSMGCQIGALGCMAPSRMRDISSIVFRAFVAGNIACLLTACIAGTLVNDSIDRLHPFPMNTTII